MNDRLLKESDVMRIAFQLPYVVNSSFFDAVKALPSADVPQGEWIKRFGSINCSVCKHSNWSDSFEDLLRSFNYCPNCGAHMKGADDDK